MSKFKNWRQSASLIVTAKTTFSKSDRTDYKLLCLKRSSKSNFMPDSYVFPGGVVSPTDKSIKWLDLFKKHGINMDDLKKLESTENLNEIYSTENSDDEIPKSVSLRITAIRETFEESGILICHSSSKIPYELNSRKWASFFGSSELRKWQHRVHKDPSEFMKLCQTFDVFPDLFALKTWCNWLTPTIYLTRFNAIFYFTSFCEPPPAFPDEKEIQKLQWLTPDMLIKLNVDMKIILPPPQYYEISKLLQVADIESLSNFASKICNYGIEEYLPYRIITPHGTYSILPGDGLYPKEVNLNLTEPEFMEELPQVSVKNRMFHKTEASNRVIIENYKQPISQLVSAL